MKNTVALPTGQPAGRIVCPECGNDSEFYEVAHEVTITTHYRQNDDGSFSPGEDESQVEGPVLFFCASCNADLTQFHDHFLEMLF